MEMDRYEMSADPLFLTRAALGGIEKEAMFKVSRDSEQWESDIMDLLHEQYPFLQEYQTRIHMNKTDAETGMGVGQIVLDNKIGIPVIIDTFKMHPLDLFYFQGKLRPLTKPSLLGSLQETGIGTPVSPGMGEAMDMSLYTDTRPPSSGRYVYAQSLQFTQDELERALGHMGEQGLAYALGMNPSFKKSAQQYAVNAVKEIKKEAAADATYQVRESRFTVFDPIMKSGAYVVITGGMNKTAGFVFDTVIDFNDNVLTGKKIFSGFGGEFAMADEMGGQEIEGDFMLHGKDADSGDLDKIAMYSDDLSPGMGFFWMTKKGHAVATLPVKITYRGTDSDGQPFVKIADVGAQGQVRKVYASDDYQGLLVDGDRVFMGPEWKWQRCGETVKVASTRAANALAWPHGVAEFRHLNGMFYLNGWDIGISKEGSATEDTYRLLSKHLGESKAFMFMKKAEADGSVFLDVEEVGGPNRSDRPRVPAGMGPVNLTKEAAFIRPIRVEFFKYAAEVTEEDVEETVDAMLGLNFINDENIHRFLEKTDNLNEAVAVLASLLLASRLGLQIEEAPIRTAMFAMDEIVRQLQQLRNVTYGSEE